MRSDTIRSDSWIGKDNRRYREVKFWVGAGYTSNFLEVEDDLGNWHLVA